MAIKKNLSKQTLPLILILIGIISRLLPHPANFTPIAATALFGGAYLSKKWALTIPLLVMLVSDMIIGFDNIPMRVAVYGSFILAVAIGFWLKKHKNIKYAFAGSFASSIVFFIVTNFAVWAFGTMYPKTPGGLIDCFAMAIPFFRNTLLGDMLYSGVFFGGYELLNKQAWPNYEFGKQIYKSTNKFQIIKSNK
jgi:hypothetical protein